MAEFKINEQREVRDYVIAEERLYLTPDRERVVRPDDPDARFLFASEGSEILREEAIRYGLVKPSKEEKAKLGDEPDEPQWPSTHKELDALGEQLGVEFEKKAKVDEKIAALEAAGHSPAAEG